MATGTAMLFLGVGSMTYSKNLIKTAMGFQVAVFGANLALFASGLGGEPRLLSDSLVLFSVVAGASVEAVGLAIIIAVHRRYGTLNPSEIRRMRH